MSTGLNIDERLSDFSTLGDDIIQIIIQVINENFEIENISKGKRDVPPMITFIDSELENVSLQLNYVADNPMATIEIESSDFPVRISVKLDQRFFASIPQEIADYLQE
ncbi:MAG: hypothetical protein ACI8ZM_003384 [Crocinitomix sp.]|jgi:hypothetical protein